MNRPLGIVDRFRERLLLRPLPLWPLLLPLFALGFYYRTLGYWTPLEFWTDEAIWASRIVNQLGSSIRPPGYVWLIRHLAEFHNTETVLRLPSWVASLASLPLLALVLRQFGFSRGLTFLGVFVLTIHPWAVGMAKEFKPYALELTLHLAIVSAALACRKVDTLWPLGLLCVLGVVAPTLAWSVALLLPWVFLALLLDCWTRKRRVRAALVVASGLASAAALLVVLWPRLTAKSSGSSVSYWGKRYDVFFVGNGLEEHALWLLKKTAQLAQFPAQLDSGLLREGFGLQAPLNWLHVAVALIGGIALFGKRRYTRLLLCVGPWATMLLLGALGKWPYGVFRTNLFVLSFTLFSCLSGVEQLAALLSRVRIARHVGAALLSAYALVVFPYQSSAFATKPDSFAVTSSVRQALEIIIQEEERRPTKSRASKRRRRRLLMDKHACAEYRYYVKEHAVYRKRLGPFYRSRVRTQCLGLNTGSVRAEVRKRLTRDFWLLTGKPKVGPSLAKYLKNRCESDYTRLLPGPTLLIHCKGNPELRSKRWRAKKAKLKAKRAKKAAARVRARLKTKSDGSGKKAK